MVRVLLTNDDGVEAKGLDALISAMRDAGHDVLVVAPEGNRSAMSHRVTVREDIDMSLLNKEPHLEVWSCSGTPADCVRLAYFAQWLDPCEAVVSGINHGVNLGEDVYYSGTFAAAVEGALLGIPSIAASQAGIEGDTGFLSEHPTSFPFAHYLARAVPTLARFQGNGLVLNVNFPVTLANKIVRECSLGSRQWTTSHIDSVERDGNTVVTNPWAKDPIPVSLPGSDFDVLPTDQATITALSVRGGIQRDERAWQSLVADGFPVHIEERDDHS